MPLNHVISSSGLVDLVLIPTSGSIKEKKKKHRSRSYSRIKLYIFVFIRFNLKSLYFELGWQEVDLYCAKVACLSAPGQGAKSSAFRPYKKRS